MYPSSTNPPALSMRLVSVEQFGRWSVDKSIALPARESTTRQSPALATTSSDVPASGSDATHTTSAVAPLAASSSLAASRNSLSVWKYASRMLLCSASPETRGPAAARMFGTRRAPTKSAAARPPCPSNTP